MTVPARVKRVATGLLRCQSSCDWTSGIMTPVQIQIERALRAVGGASKCAGVIALSPEDEERFGAWGARYLQASRRGLLRVR